MSVGSLGTVGEQIGSRSSAYLGIPCFSSYSTLLLQLDLDASQTQLSTSTGDTGPSNLDAGPSDLEAHKDYDLGGDDLRVPSPEPPPV